MSTKDLESKFLEVTDKAKKLREKADELERLAQSYSHVLAHLGVNTIDLLDRIEKSNEGFEDDIPWDILKSEMERILQDFPGGLHYKRLHEFLISKGLNVGPVTKFRFKAYRLKNFGYKIHKGEIQKEKPRIHHISFDSLSDEEKRAIEQHERDVEDEIAREQQMLEDYHDSQEEEDPW